jgi:uncharacterized membrane protein YukC
MPPKVRSRENYTQDITTLNRICAAVKSDTRISVEDRESVVTDLHRAIKKLMSFELHTIGVPSENGEAKEEIDGKSEEESEENQGRGDGESETPAE